MAFISRSRRTELLSFEHVKREFDKGKANDLPANFILKDGQFSYEIIRQRDDRGLVFKIIAERTIFSLESIQHCNSRTHEFANKLRGLVVAQDLDDKSKPVESKPVESKPVESKPVESKPVESKPVESKPVESKPVESKPVESKPVESKPVESKPVESKLLQFRSRNPQRVDNSAKNMHDQL